MLTQEQKRFLFGLAHSIDPVVLIGKNGLTEAVLKEVDTALKSHELIKIRIASGEKEDRQTMFESICKTLQAHPVKLVGKIIVIYRRADKPKIALP